VGTLRALKGFEKKGHNAGELNKNSDGKTDQSLNDKRTEIKERTIAPGGTKKAKKKNKKQTPKIAGD